MANNKKPRKAYKPKAKTTFGGLHIVGKRTLVDNPMTDEERTTVLTDYFAALSAMLEGRATIEHFDSLAYAVNIAQVLTLSHMGTEYRDIVQAAMHAMTRCKNRYQKTKKMGLDGEGLQAMRDFEPLFEAILSEATARELVAATRESMRRVEGGILFGEAA